MKNPFSFLKPKKSAESAKEAPAAEEISTSNEQESDDIPEVSQEAPEVTHEAPADSFIEWGRSQTHGGIERRERNDIFEAYSVYGTDDACRLICRYYHRYPEHEKDFGLSYSRALTFDEFNRRLLSELDKGDMKPEVYRGCMEKAEALCSPSAIGTENICETLGESDADILRGFCDELDTMKDKSYISSGGIFRCDCESVAGGERLCILFRKPVKYDASLSEVPGVLRRSVGGYEIDDMWIMSVYNRLYDRCSSCKVILLTSEWSLDRESVYLISCGGFKGIDGELLAAVGKADDFRRFGFYSLDFSK